jgi:hypothetical protein
MLKTLTTAGVLIGLTLGAAACGASAPPAPNSPAPSSPATSAASAVQSVPQPETAQQAAASLAATDFTDCGASGALAGVVDSGTARYHGYRIGINTFAGAKQRDHWVSAVANFGIVPMFKGANWVAYKAQSQHGRACS